MNDRARLRRAFSDQTEFALSPLYNVLSQVVAANDQALDLAAQGRPGQIPTFLLFGAVHHLLLSGIDHPLAQYYESIVGDEALPPAEVGPTFASFCRQYEAELSDTIRTRLVQTSQVQRSLGLRLGLSVIAAEVGAPVHVIEVGASAGLNLRYDRYGFTVGEHEFGDRHSSVQTRARLHGKDSLPDLDVLPEVASVLGIDLNPIDARDAGAVRWLEALVWPENAHQRGLLAAALALVADDPPPIRAGDAIDVLPQLAAELTPGEPRVVFHTATRMHVPVERQPAFDAAIASMGDTGPMWWLSIENSSPDADPRLDRSREGSALHLRRPDGSTRTIAIVNGHLRWIEMI